MTTIPDKTTDKFEVLNSALKGLESVVIAFSGGVDSTFLLKAARDVLGDRVLAVTAASETYPERELAEARRLAAELGARHIVIESGEVDIPAFAENPSDRCYYCKHELFSLLIEIAGREDIKYVADGANADDTGDFRPGSRAACELKVVSPLKEAGLTKDDIRMLSREAGLDTWDKPALACLSSRFPYGEGITREKLTKVGQAEDFLLQQGFSQVRVRHHDGIARIELVPEEIGRLAADSLREEVAAKLKEIGFTYVTVDLQGYRTGSMNEVLSESERGGGA